MTDEEWKEAFRRIGTRLPFSYYWATLDPHEMIEPGDLGGDDLADIYRDWKPGLFAAEAGDSETARFEFRVGFMVHWGMHAVDAMRAIHIWIQDEQ